MLDGWIDMRGRHLINIKHIVPITYIEASKGCVGATEPSRFVVGLTRYLSSRLNCSKSSDIGAGHWSKKTDLVSVSMETLAMGCNN